MTHKALPARLFRPAPFAVPNYGTAWRHQGNKRSSCHTMSWNFKPSCKGKQAHKPDVGQDIHTSMIRYLGGGKTQHIPSVSGGFFNKWPHVFTVVVRDEGRPPLWIGGQNSDIQHPACQLLMQHVASRGTWYMLLAHLIDRRGIGSRRKFNRRSSKQLQKMKPFSRKHWPKTSVSVATRWPCMHGNLTCCSFFGIGFAVACIKVHLPSDEQTIQKGLKP